MKRIVSVLLAIVLLLSIIAGITVSAQASVAGIPYLSPLKNKYVIGEGANQFDFFEKYIAIEAMKEWEQNVYSRPSIETSVIDEYAQKIGVINSNGKPNTNLSEYERIAKIYQYAHLTHTYSTSQESGWNIAIFIRSGICQTFSGIINEFCKRAGIECWQIWGGADHAWNVVKLDGKYYAIDVARNKFLTEPSAGVASWKTDATTVTSANNGTCYDSSTGSGTGVQQWINKVGSSNLATSTYSKTKIDEYGELVNPSTTLATPSVVSTTATDEGVVVKFKGVSNADWYEVYTAPIDGVMNNVSIERWGEKTNYSGDFVYYKQSYMDGDFKFTKSATIHSIDKNESGQYQCFLENSDGNGLIVFVVAKNINGECNLATDFSAITGTTNNEKLVSLIGKNYLKPADEGKDKTSGKTITDATAAQINSTNYVLYKSNAKHLATNGNHAYSKVVTVRVAGAGTQGAEVYECKNCLQREMRYTDALPALSLATPKLSSVANATTGVKISWGKVSGAAKYRVFYKTASGDWTKAGDTTSTSFTWEGAKNNTKYTFTVRCISSDGKTYTSSYDKTGKSIWFYSAPAFSAPEGGNSGVIIKWNKVGGVSKYAIFRKVSDGSYAKIGTSNSTSFVDKTAKKGVKYVYTVRCLSNVGNSYVSSFNTGKSITYVATPKVSSISNVVGGVKISWGKVSGAAKYRVFYKIGNETTWHKVGDTTSTNYTFTKVKDNTKYTFTVRCITGDGKTYASGYNTTGKSIWFYSAPTVTSLEGNNSGVTIKWNKVGGVSKYVVYRKLNGGEYAKIGTVNSTSYTDKTAKTGKKYIYTVRCLSNDGKVLVSSYNAGKSITYLATPKVSSLTNVADGVQIKWNKVSGATKYAVFYKTGKNGWKKIATTTSTSYTWKGAKNNTTYAFTVRCVSSDGKSFVSGYNTSGKSIKFLSAPKISSVNKNTSSVTIKWGKVTGAAKYRVFYRVGNGEWKKLKDTTSTSFTWSGWKNLKKGTNYTFTVRCISKDGKTYTSGYTSGKSITK